MRRLVCLAALAAITGCVPTYSQVGGVGPQGSDASYTLTWGRKSYYEPKPLATDSLSCQSKAVQIVGAPEGAATLAEFQRCMEGTGWFQIRRYAQPLEQCAPVQVQWVGPLPAGVDSTRADSLSRVVASRIVRGFAPHFSRRSLVGRVAFRVGDFGARAIGENDFYAKMELEEPFTYMSGLSGRSDKDDPALESLEGVAVMRAACLTDFRISRY